MPPKKSKKHLQYMQPKLTKENVELVMRMRINSVKHALRGNNIAVLIVLVISEPF